MPITKFPPDLKTPQTLPCHLCRANIPPSKATLGPVTANGEQLYACAAHLQQASWQYLMSWIAIIILYRSSSYSSLPGYQSAASGYGHNAMGSSNARPVC
jgi:hypothetical protein